MKNRGSNCPSGKAGCRLFDRQNFALAALVLVGVLVALFWRGFLPGNTIASNDGPLGAISAECAKLPSGMLGNWMDLNWLGVAGPNAAPNVTDILAIIVGKLLFSKIFAPFALCLLGLGAWLCFRQWGLSRLACILGALAATLNSGYFSAAAWGVASQPLAFGLDFFALAALADQSSPKRWLRVILAGFAVGMNVMEAFDLGALFSLAIAAFLVFQALNRADKPAKKILEGGSRLTVVAGCAGLIAATSIVSLVTTQIKGISGMGQDPAEKAARWDEATMWSLPKREALNLFIPGLYGFRMDTPKDMAMFGRFFENGQYWGAVGRDPRLYSPETEKTNPGPNAQWRFTGGGNYAGLLVVLMAIWAVAQSFRREQSPFDLQQRRFIWFLGGVVFVSLLLSFGKFAPFYKLFYALPYASTIRNPGKFLHLLAWALVILFAYGVDSLCRLYLMPVTEKAVADKPEQKPAEPLGLRAHMDAWWPSAPRFDRTWLIACLGALGLSVVGWFIYGAMRGRLVAYLTTVGFDKATGEVLASFSLRQAAWFVLVFALALFLVALTMSGFFRGARAKWGRLFLGAFLVLDLGAANLPWVIVWNYRQKYDLDVNNPVLDFLKKEPYEGRVAIFPVERFLNPKQEMSEGLRHMLGLWALFQQLYGIEWKQHQFQYDNIQSLDVIMMPRPPVDYIEYESNMPRFPIRYWELTDTRYFLAPYPFLAAMNQGSPPDHPNFREVLRFDITTKNGDENWTKLEELTAVANTNGNLALIELSSALPRAKLYSNYIVSTNGHATLEKLLDPKLDIQSTVIVDDPLPPVANTNAPAPGSVKFVSYAPKDIVLQAEAKAPCILLLNDRYDPTWQVTLDGKPAPLLKCNFLMRGVQVPAGSHRIEFTFRPPTWPFWVSSATVFLGLCLLGWLGVTGAGREDL